VTVEEAVARVPEFNGWNHAERIRFLMWYLHTQRKQEYVRPGDVRSCLAELRIDGPASYSPFFHAMVSRKPKEALRTSKGYQLERRVREAFNAKYAQRGSMQALTKELQDLESKVANADQRAYLDEAIICFKNKAFRAAIVMSWNLGYDHLLRYIFNDPQRLADFNRQLQVVYQKKPPVAAINKFDDFGFMKEDQVLTVGKSATILSNSRHKVMKEKLDRRNAVAHPGGLVVNDVTAEEFIRDLIDNVIVKLV
jgi:hypothetical protein